MKKRMLKTVSFLLVVALLLGFAPAGTVFATSELSNVKIVYSLKSPSGAQVNVDTFGYKETHGFWEYYSVAKGYENAYRVATRDYLSMHSYGAHNGYIAFKINVPAKGEYEASLSFCSNSDGVSAGTVHIIPPSEEDIPAAIGSGKYLAIENIPFYSASKVTGNTISGKCTIEASGTHYLVFSQTSTTSAVIRPETLTLNGGTNTVPMCAELKSDNEEIVTDESFTIELSKVYMSDGALYDKTPLIGTPESDNPSVATVDKNGTITGVSPGEAVITLPVTAEGVTVNASMKVTIVEPSPIGQATLSLSKTELKPGASATSSVSAKLENGEAVNMEKTTVAYSTEDTDIISVDSDSGAIKALSAGTATVTAAVTYRGKTAYAQADITVLPIAAPSGVRVEYSMEIASIPNDGQMDSTKFSDTKNSWQFEGKYNNPSIQRNTIYGTIAYPNSGAWWAVRMYVPKAGSYSLKLDRGLRPQGGLVFFYFGKASEGASEIVKGEHIAEEKFYATADTASEETDSLGTVEIDAPGEYIMVMRTPLATDFATAGLNASNRRHFIKKIILDGGNETVEKMRFTLKPEYNEVYVGGNVKTALDNLYLSDGSTVSMVGAEINYSSSDEAIATVNEKGVIVGVSDGNAEITATVTLESGEKVTAKANIAVVTPPDLESVTAYVENSELEVISNAQINLSGKNADGSDTLLHMTTVTYETNNYSVASVDKNGLITAKTPGDAVITVNVRQGFVTKSDTVDITVINSRDEENPMELSNEMVYYDLRTSAPSGTALWDLTYNETKNWIFYGYANGMQENTSTARVRLSGSYGIQAQPNAIGAAWAVKITVPKAGRYAATLIHGVNANGGIANVYVLPVTEDTTQWTDGRYSVGTVNFYRTALGYDLSTNLKDIEFPQAGDYLLVFESAGKGAGGALQQFPKALSIDGTGVISYVEVFLEESEINVGDSIRMLYRIKLSDGTWLSESDDVIFFSSDPAVASVTSKGVVTGKSEGEAYITIMVKRGGKTETHSSPIRVNDVSSPAGIELRGPATVYVEGTGSFVQRAVMESTGKISLTPEQVSYRIVGGDGVANITPDGKISGVSEGEVEIVASAFFRDTYIESEVVTVNVIPKTQKTEPTLFTYDMRKNGIENVKKYDWAEVELDWYLKYADVYVDNAEQLYNMMIPEGIPRARYCAMNGNDPTYSSCKYCGDNFLESRGTSYFTVDAFNRPWKVQCPTCKRLFPSNDFGSFYELGVDEHGAFKREVALEENGILCKRGERDKNGVYVPYKEYEDNPYGYGDPKGYLYNELYTELYETGLDPVTKEPITHAWGDFTIDVNGDGKPDSGYFWGVDDGYGYYTGKEYKSGSKTIPEVHPYVANYMYHGPASISNMAVRCLAHAYMLTGDIKYGRLGAVVLDRLADTLPDMSTGQYPFLVTDGGEGIGKIQGALNDCTVLRIFAQGCDALYPLIDDPQVIEYLSAKSEKYGLENPKLSGSDIWSNWADGILRETYKSCLNTKLRGGFGHKHEALATAAVVLDSMPETEEMLDWLFKAGFEDKVNLICNGGNTNVELMATLDRDGFGNHGSPNYNKTWIEFLMYVQNAIDDYDRYDKYDLFDNPKFAKMFTVFTPFTLVSKYTAQIGDSGYTGSQTFETPAMEDLVYAYKRLGDKSIAKLLYLQNGMTTEGIHDDIFVKNPEAIADEIEDIVESEGQYLESEMLTGAGFAVLRDGELIKSAGTNATYDSQRDFWMYFGRTEGHGHTGSLNLGIDAFGYNFAPDFGYPEDANTSPRRLWLDGTLSHNTVVVNTKNQKAMSESTSPLHFDAGENVGVMDVDSSAVYDETRVYRRTLVSVKVSDEISYGVDFFKVLGGNDQIYTFRAHSDEIYETEGLTLTKQVDETTGEYKGTYASEEVEIGMDPGFIENGTPTYPTGFTFLKNIRRDETGKDNFAVDFKIRDFQKVLPHDMNLHLRMTALNDFEADEVAITSAFVPRKGEAAKYYDTLEQVLIRRKGSGTLNSLFTTVYEPYKDARYIKKIEALPITPVDGDLSAVDAAKAVKVTHTSGRIDYIAYSTDEKRSYTIYDESVGRTLEFTGFVGVLSYKDNELIYSYIHDGARFGSAESNLVRLTGTVTGFEKELTRSNYIIVKPDADIATTELAGKYINVKNDGVRNGMYKIISALPEGDDEIKLDIGGVSTIRAYRDTENPDEGFVYDIAEGQVFTIGLTDEVTNNPEFTPVSDKSTSAGSSINVTVNATSPIGKSITYSALQLPRGASFNADAATVIWKPDSSQIGDNRVSILATDEDGREETLHFVITVYGSTTGKPSTDNTTEPPLADGSGTASDSTGSAGGGGGGGAAPTDKPDDETKTDDDESLLLEEKVPSAGEADEVEKTQFIDLGNHAWAEGAINTLAADGIIKGTSASTFSPADNITRADFALLLVRAFNLTSDNDENFADVSGSDYFASELAIARNTGLVNGIGDNKYAPRSSITRQDMMVIVYRALEASLALKGSETERNVGAAMNDSPVDYQNRDVTEPGEMGPSNNGGGILHSQYPDFGTVAPYAREAVSALVGAGLVNGKNNLIAPTDYTTRAEVAVLIKRILDYTK